MTQSITNTYRLHCLARSNMEKELAKKGCSITTSIAQGDGFRLLLKEKFIEEVHEFLAATTTEDMITELADIHEVLRAFYKEYGINSEVVAAYQEQKRIERGDFTGLVIETITCEAGSPADKHLSNRGRKNVQ
jgi:predicted house-cleaning noncanonical NTP pyrophosphatase (MazG superfamily)